jgi:hypothetical protein
VLTSFLLSLSQTVLIITTTVTRNVTAPLAKTIANATVIVGIGTGKGTGTVAGETETTVNAILTVIGNAQTAVTATGIVNAVVIAMKDARATRKNADGSSRAKTTDVGHTAAVAAVAARTRGAPLVVPAGAGAASVTVVARQNAGHPHLWARSYCRNGSARRVVGTSMHRAMSNTLRCRRNKRVRME